MQRIVMVVALAALVAGCGSSVKLDDVAVEDRSGTAVRTQPGAVQPGAATTAGVISPGSSGGSGSTVTSTTIAPVTIAAPGAAATAPTGPRIVYFDYDSFAINPEFQGLIDVHARFLRSDKARRVNVEGHTDERGGREYNLALGQKRAEAVRRALALLGVPDGQIEAVSFGKEKPAVAGSDEAAMAKNRRAEITYR